MSDIDDPEYNYSAMGCGLEDRNITDRYEAMQYGWEQGNEAWGEIVNDIEDNINELEEKLEKAEAENKELKERLDLHEPEAEKEYKVDLIGDARKKMEAEGKDIEPRHSSDMSNWKLGGGGEE